MKLNEYSRQHFGVSCDEGKRQLNSITTIVMHSTEGGDAESAASYLHGRPDGSAHLVVDENDAYLMASPSTIVCGVGGFNSPTISIEQAGYAHWSKVQWLRRREEIRRAAYWCAHYMLRLDLPPRYLSAHDLRQGQRRGWTTHWEVTKSGIASTTHTDPGRAWPRLLFQHYLNSYMRQGRKGGLKVQERHG